MFLTDIGKKYFFIVMVIILLPLSLLGQDEVLNNNPTSIKWRQVNTPGFQIIYPTGFDREAQRMANTLQHLYTAESETMGDAPPRKIPLILQNQNAISNGFVTLGPRRSEFYTTPPQDYNFIGTNRWLDLLAVHEFRHIVQFQHSKTGWNKLFYYLFGEYTQAGMAFAAGPSWFWEGDATAIESAYTHSGRGRIPSFNRVFRANLLEGKRFSYHKQHLRSYKDFVPNHYVLGYHYITHLRRRTGDPEIWEKVSKSAFGRPFIPFTFSNALKKHTGSYIIGNYEMMMDELDSLWSHQLEGVGLSAFERVSRGRSDDFTDYSFPQVLENGKVVALKSGIGDVEQFVNLNDRHGGKKEYMPGIMNNSGMLSSAQNKVVWNEFHFDPRWRVKTYSVIKAYDFETGKAKTITRKSRYSAAAISPDGNKIAAVLNTTDNDNYLVVLDYESGDEIKRFKNPENAFYSMPRWSDEGDQLVALRTTDAGKAVVSVDYLSGEERVLIASGSENIGHPVLYKKFLFYNSPYSGIDNIYSFHLETKRKYRVTSSKYGAYNPHLTQDGHIYYNDHTVNGMDVVKMPFDTTRWTPIEEVADRSVKYYKLLVEQEGHEDILSEVPDIEYPVKKYSKLGHMINIHSWGPFASTDLNKAEVGIFSTDVLSTTALSLGYTYDIQEETGFASAAMSYQGWYPIVDVKVHKGKRVSNRVVNNREVKMTWDELSVETGLRLPLVLTRSKYYTSLSLENSVQLTQVTDFENSVIENERLAPVNDSLAFFFRNELTNGDLISNRVGLTFSRRLKRSARDLRSEWGQSLTVEYYNTPYGGDFTGSLLALRANLYFPSPLKLFFPRGMKHHSLFVRFGYQLRRDELTTNLYYFRNRIPKPRGFGYPQHAEFTSLLLNYSLPLWYPDIALGPVLNIKRFRANGFFDMGQGKGKDFFFRFDEPSESTYFSNRDKNYYSIGGELFVDFNIMRFQPEISLGARYSYLLTTNQINIDFVVGSIAF